MKTKIKLCKKAATALLFQFWLFGTIFIQNVYAASIVNSKLFTGGKKLISDLTKGLTGLIAGTAILFFIYNGIKMQAADDEMEEKQYKKKMKKNVVYAVIAVLGGVLINIILSYFK